MTNLFHGNIKRMLHVAPEAVFEALLKRHLGAAYLTADLREPACNGQDGRYRYSFSRSGPSTSSIAATYWSTSPMTDWLSESSFVSRRPMAGRSCLFRSMRTKLSRPFVTDPEERLRLFGNRGHVRRYGPDFADRLRDAGFKVKVTRTSDFLSRPRSRRWASPETPARSTTAKKVAIEAES